MKRLLLLFFLLFTGCNQFEIRTYNVEIQNGESVEKFVIQSRGAPTVSYRNYDMIVTGNTTNEMVVIPGPIVKSITEKKAGEINGNTPQSVFKQQ